MQWTCKYCTFCAEKRGYLLKHYRLKHGCHTRISPLPCLHKECLCTFKSFNALKVHLSTWHTQKDLGNVGETAFHCQLCDFVEPGSEANFFTHLRRHLKLKQKVSCPFQGCNFQSNVYSTFNAHKSKEHQDHNKMAFKPEIVSHNVLEEPPPNMNTQTEDSASETDDVEAEVTELSEDVEDLESQLEHNVAALFLKMSSILNISENALQELIEQINQIYVLSQPLLHTSIRKILNQHCGDVETSLVSEIAKVFTKSNVFLKFTSTGGSLSTTRKRTSYISKEFSVVTPVEFVLKNDRQTVVYIPILKMLQTLLNNGEILDKAMSSETNLSQGYRSHRDGSRFKDNSLLTEEEFRIALCLYIDDFEVANPLGTSRKKHKLCAIYWVLGNLHPKYRSALHSIQLALLCKVSSLKDHGYGEILHHLLQDLVSLEQQGVYVEQLGASIKGTVLFVAADNLAAHSLGGFFESFTVSQMCRFCMAKREEIQHKEVRTGSFQQRTKENHDRQVLDVLQDPTMAQQYGVKRCCPLTETLEHFHVVNGYPPDLLHDLLEGVVPAELALCLKALISKGYFSLETLNVAIKQFPYTFSDKTNQPQLIPKNFASKATIGGNGHENWTLLRLLPLLIGHHIPEGDETWEVLMNLKDVVELSMSASFSEESVCFLDCKIAEHRDIFQEVFPNEKLRPKHHYIEHYPQLIKTFGPLCDVWTMRFEGKHKFFKKVVRHIHNFKNIPLTLALRHQHMIAFHLAATSFFKPSVEINRVKSVMVDSFPENVKNFLCLRNNYQNTVLAAASVCIDGIKYSADMVISVGSCSGLPDFRQIAKIVVINTEIFVCKLMTSWYNEHLRAYELCRSHLSTFSVTQLSELNDVFPLSLYRVGDKQLVTLKRHILC